MKLGETIRARRQAMEMTQRELARLVGASAAYINDIELERRTPRDRERLTQIAETLVLPADVLLYCLGLLRSEDGDYRSMDTIVQAYEAFYAVLDGANPVSKPVSNSKRTSSNPSNMAPARQKSQTE